MAYNESIYNAIENNITLQTRTISQLGGNPEPVANIKGTEFLYEEGQNVLTGFDLSWISPVINVAGFRVQYRLGNNNWSTETTASPSLRIAGLHAGTLEVQIQVLNNIGNTSVVSPAQFSLVGKTAVPGDVQNLSIESISANSARLRWDQTVDLDVKTGGFIKIRHSAKNDGTATWSDSIDLIPAKSGTQTEAIVPLLEGEILVKFEDDGGRQSENAARVIVDFPDTLGALVVQTRREDQDAPPFQGTKTNTVYDAGFDALKIDSVATIPAEGTYQFLNTLDLGNVFSLDLRRYFVTRGFFPSDLIDSRTELVDTWSDWDGAISDSVNASLYLRRTDDNPAGSPVWSEYQPFVNGTFLGRAFQFKAVMSSTDPAENILIDELGYESTFQRRTEQSNGNIASGAGTKTVTFDKPFFVGTASLGGVNAYLPSIGITAQNMATGDYFVVGTVTGTSFQVTFRNSAGTAVDRNFTYMATGYGRGL